MAVTSATKLGKRALEIFFEEAKRAEMKYRITIERHTRETAEVEIEAESVAAAKDEAVARARSGDVVWSDDVTSIEATEAK